MKKLTYEEWIQNWRDVQRDGKLDYATEEGASEAWDYQQDVIDKLEAKLLASDDTPSEQ